MLTEREKKVSLDITGDFYEVKEMREELKLSECLGCKVVIHCYMYIFMPTNILRFFTLSKGANQRDCGLW